MKILLKRLILMSLVLTACVGQLHGMGQKVKNVVTSKPFKHLVATGICAAAFYDAHSVSEDNFALEFQDHVMLPDLDSEKNAYVQEIMANKAPACFDLNLIDKILLKKAEYCSDDEGAVIRHKDQMLMMLPDRVSCGAILHELGHIHYDHATQRIQAENTFEAISLYALASYLLNGAGKKRFLIAPLAFVMGEAYLKPLILNAHKNMQECQADDFAIQAAIEHSDLDSLREDAKYFSSRVDIENAIAKIKLASRPFGAVSIEFSNKTEAIHPNFFRTLALLESDHPAAKLRAAKFERAAEQLVQNREIKE